MLKRILTESGKIKLIYKYSKKNNDKSDAYFDKLPMGEKKNNALQYISFAKLTNYIFNKVTWLEELLNDVDIDMEIINKGLEKYKIRTGSKFKFELFSGYSTKAIEKLIDDKHYGLLWYEQKFRGTKDYNNFENTKQWKKYLKTERLKQKEKQELVNKKANADKDFKSALSKGETFTDNSNEIIIDREYTQNVRAGFELMSQYDLYTGSIDTAGGRRTAESNNEDILRKLRELKVLQITFKNHTPMFSKKSSDYILKIK